MKTIEIPFGTKDSELQEFEYTIPDSYEAKIKDGKVIIQKKESEDEKTRKWLIKMVEEFRKANPTNAEHNGNCSEAIAYLEKQKEQNLLPPISSGTRYYFDEWLQLQTMPKLWDAFLAGIDFNKKERTPSAEETELNSAAFLEQLGYTCIKEEELKKIKESERVDGYIKGVRAVVNHPERYELTKQLKTERTYISKDFEDIWKNENCSNIISEGQNLSPRFEELLKEVCHAWYDEGIKAKQEAKDKYDRMAPIYDNKESFESALDKAWKFYNESSSRTVDSFEDDYIECVFSKGFREGFLCGKQKEQNPMQTTREKQYVVTLDRLIDEYLDSHLNLDKTYYDHIREWLGGRHKEQKPTEKDWLKDYEERVDAEIGSSCYAEKDCEQLAEWSEEDEKIRYDIECALKFFLNEGSAVCPGTNTLKEEAISWLKSLRPQPKAEWSEEDEKRLESVIHRTEVICGGNAYGEIKEDIDWLKSLRPNHWKPSEEQMQYLSKAISYCIQNGNEKTACVIKELKNDLEKL